jgi:drug/metabolite transporter (DMT)-like permease
MKTKVYTAALAYALITGLSFLFGKIGLISVNPLDLLAYRFTAAFLAVLFLLLFRLVKVNYSSTRVMRSIPLALLYPLAFFSLQTFGLQYASSSEAGIMTASIPVFTLILATLFLKEKTTSIQKLSILASVAGVVYLTLAKSSALEFNNSLGMILLLASALAFSGYSILARILTRDFSSIELSTMMITTSFVFFSALAVCRHLLDGSVTDFLQPLASMQFLGSVLYLGVLSTLITSLLTNYILSKIEASKMSVFSNLGTVISILAGAVFLNEQLFYYHIVGSILIVGGVLGANLRGGSARTANS